MTTPSASESNRELDKWIAENVMGWVPHCRNSAFYVERKDHNQMLVGNEIRAFVSDWHPTARPADAMEVLKKCAETVNGDVQIYHSDHFDDGPWCLVNLTLEKQVAGYGETLELAICRFAKSLFQKERE